MGTFEGPWVTSPSLSVPVCPHLSVPISLYLSLCHFRGNTAEQLERSQTSFSGERHTAGRMAQLTGRSEDGIAPGTTAEPGPEAHPAREPHMAVDPATSQQFPGPAAGRVHVSALV